MQHDLDFSEAVALAPQARTASQKAPWHLYAIGLAAVFWNGLGLFGFLATLTRFPPYMDQFSEVSREYWTSLPDWIFAIWGVAVVTALAGAVMLLKRQLLAVRMLALSATTTVLAMAASYSRPAPDGSSDAVSAVCIIVIALLVLHYAMLQGKRGVLR